MASTPISNQFKKSRRNPPQERVLPGHKLLPEIRTPLRPPRPTPQRPHHNRLQPGKGRIHRRDATGLQQDHLRSHRQNGVARYLTTSGLEEKTPRALAGHARCVRANVHTREHKTTLIFHTHKKKPTAQTTKRNSYFL